MTMEAHPCTACPSPCEHVLFRQRCNLCEEEITTPQFAVKLVVVFGGDKSKALDVCESCFAFQPVVLGDLVHGGLDPADEENGSHAALLVHRIASLPPYRSES
ncbi:hypothetical protein [Kitasatospora sp. CB01950]|uniref:hypothetical protein n=1 Tax=Kitasatospora sp. CB01950 TaxID=1703930 RepID=UPI00116115E8|nr:hypothetical protein [Kitasatospora sp. CB01950]